VILIGAVLLSLPAATESSVRLPIIDALFTSTSAVCVTGLIVANTGATFSTFGELVVMALIQVGGLGIMTMSTLFALLARRRIGLRERILLRESMGTVNLSGIVRLVRYVLILTLVVEGLGALSLTYAFSHDYPLGRALYLGVFHSISAFNNAGFDLLSASFTGYVSHPLVNTTIIMLIILGGIGFTVIMELFDRRRGRVSLHTRVVVLTTIALIVIGSLLALAFEYDNPATMGDLPWTGKLWASIFLAVTPRTAGFSTVPTGQLRPLTLLVIIVLMWIGGSPVSTAGGIKTTTLSAILSTVRGTIVGLSETQLFNRRINPNTVNQAWAVALISTMVVLATTGALLHTEKLPLMDVLFEATSAFGTVGLTTGITPDLSALGRALIITTMYVGRLGPLTLAVAIGRRQRHQPRVRHPEDRIIVG